ncbi:hypothetical protein HaLaN_15033, partial [Haematococcus lacustris]
MEELVTSTLRRRPDAADPSPARADAMNAAAPSPTKEHQPRAVVQKATGVSRVLTPGGDVTEPTYWTTNQWGAPARPNTSLGL